MKPVYYILLLLSFTIYSCGTIDVFERMERFPKHEWSSNTDPLVKFDISDTTSFYNIYVVLRHTDAYRYNNIWLNVTTQSPNDTPRTQLLNVALADNTKGWLGAGMDDVFDRRARITQAPIKLKKGTYTFKLHQAMREDPLGYIMSVGIRVEKVKP